MGRDEAQLRGAKRDARLTTSCPLRNNRNPIAAFPPSSLDLSSLAIRTSPPFPPLPPSSPSSSASRTSKTHASLDPRFRFGPFGASPSSGP